MLQPPAKEHCTRLAGPPGIQRPCPAPTGQVPAPTTVSPATRRSQSWPGPVVERTCDDHQPQHDPPEPLPLPTSSSRKVKLIRTTCRPRTLGLDRPLTRRDPWSVRLRQVIMQADAGAAGCSPLGGAGAAARAVSTSRAAAPALPCAQRPRPPRGWSPRASTGSGRRGRWPSSR